MEAYLKVLKEAHCYDDEVVCALTQSRKNECSRRYLQHVRDAFLHAERAQGRDWDLSEGEIVLTVPASLADNHAWVDDDL